MKATLKNFYTSCLQNVYSLWPLSTNATLCRQPVAETDYDGVKLVFNLVGAPSPPTVPRPHLLMLSSPHPQYFPNQIAKYTQTHILI